MRNIGTKKKQANELDKIENIQLLEMADHSLGAEKEGEGAMEKAMVVKVVDIHTCHRSTGSP